MAVSWGAWEYAGNNGMRVGLEAYGGSTVTTGSTTYTYKVDFWTANQYNHDGDTQTLPYSWVGVSSSINYTNNEGTGTTTKRGTKTVTYTYTTWGSSPGARTVNAGPISGSYHGATPSHSIATTIPARPYAPSYAPTGVTTTRNSDAQATVSGTHPSDAQHPNSSMTIQQRTYTGSAWSGYTDIYTGTGTSHIVTGLSANHAYQFQMRLNNPAGSSAFVPSNDIYMTPAAPSSVAASWNQSTGHIAVTWVNNAFATGLTYHAVERSANGGAWTAVTGYLPQSTLSWTDTAPYAGTNQYRVVTWVRDHPSSGSLASAWANSNVVSVGDCWVWDGTTAIPAMVTVWNGTAEIQSSLQVV